jgi:hypothetical protein
VRAYEPPANVYGILAAPPCAMFSLARRTAKTPPDITGAMEVVGACLRIVWRCRAGSSLKFWALENPVGLLRQFLGKPALTFEPWEFGAKKSKRTDLWGYFNPPRKTVRKKPDGLGPSDAVWQHPQCPPEYRHLNLGRAGIRALTPAEFATAFSPSNP